MPEQRQYQGQTYQRSGPGEPWVLVPQQRGVVIADPYRAAEEERKTAEERRREQDQEFERQRLALAQQQAALAAQAAGITAEKAGREQAASEARGGVETTESERTAAFLATRLAGGIQDLQAIGMGRAPSLFEATAGQTTLGNFTNEEDWQRTLGAQRDILDAALTLGTGAAYTKEQLEGYRQAYFPQPGDKPATIADKRQRLARLLEAAKVKSGAAGGQIADALGSSGLVIEGGVEGRWTPEQERIYDAFMAANPTASADDVRKFAESAGLPNISNIEEIVAARDAGQGVSPAANAMYEDSVLAQGLSGVNEGIASTLGLPVDVMTWGMNLVPRGINAIANTDIPTITDPVLGGEWWRDLMAPTIYDETADPTAQFVRRAGESVGAALVPVGAAANTARQFAGAMGSAASGGIGAASAQTLFPDSIEAEIAGELLGSFGTGYGALKLGQRTAQRSIEDAIPTVDELKVEAGDLYRQAEARGEIADPTMTQELADNVQGILRSSGRVSPTGRLSEVYPKVKEAAQLINDYAGQPMNPTQVQTVRSVVADGMQSADRSERAIARALLDEFDDWAAQSVPGLDDARAVASRYLNAEKLDQAWDLAGARAGQFTGSGFENALRTEYRALDRNTIKGRDRYDDAILGAIMDVSRGTPGSNAARAVGRFAPTGVVSSTLATGVPFMIGNAVGGPLAGGVLGALTAGAGLGGRALATNMGIRNAERAQMIARNGGEIATAPLVDEETGRVIAALLAGQQGQFLPSEGEYQP